MGYVFGRCHFCGGEPGYQEEHVAPRLVYRFDNGFQQCTPCAAESAAYDAFERRCDEEAERGWEAYREWQYISAHGDQ